MRKVLRGLRDEVDRAGREVHETACDSGQPRGPAAIFDSPMPRILEPELLDSLAPHDPDAVHSRRDLRLTNRILGNYRWLTRTLRRQVAPGEVALELGAGTGELGDRLARAGVISDAIDRCPPPPHWPKNRAWHTADLRFFTGYERYPVVFGNLIFHHLDDGELAQLGLTFGRHCRVIVACEPVRRPSSQTLFAAIAPLLRANHVTLHDARISIAAGFVRDELPRALGLVATEWEWRCTTTLLGVYQMVARRRSS